MKYSKERLRRIYDKTGGYCYHCYKKLAFTNYGWHPLKGAWEVEHSKPVSQGGTDHLNNLFPSCLKCNRKKGDKTKQQFDRVKYK